MMSVWLSELREGETLDIIGGDQLSLIQPKNGYRFSIDSLLLWGFLRPDPNSHWVDLGAGCGILSIALARINGVRSVTAVEIQPSLAELIRRNVILNGVTSKITCIEGDIRDPKTLENISPADGICVNPPYYKSFSGRINPNREKALARHELRGTLKDFIRGGHFVLKRGGCYNIILPVARLSDAIPLFLRSGLFPARLRLIHPYEAQPATHFLLNARKGVRKELTIYPPVIIYSSVNTYTREIENLLRLIPLKYP